MNWNFLLSFAIGLAVYLCVLGIVALIKRYRNKKKFNKETEVRENEEHKE